MKSSSFTCITPLLPNRGVSPYVIASPSATCMEPSNRAESTPFLSGEATQTPRVCTHRAMATGKKTSQSFRLTGCGLSFHSQCPKHDIRKPVSCQRVRAQRRTRHSTDGTDGQHHESPMSSQHGGRLCSVEALYSELPRTSVSEKSIGNCEMAVRHQLYHTRHEGSLEESTVGGLRQRSLSYVPKHLISTVEQS